MVLTIGLLISLVVFCKPNVGLVEPGNMDPGREVMQEMVTILMRVQEILEQVATRRVT